MRKGVFLVTIYRRPTKETECYAVYEEAIGTTSMYTTYIPRASQSADKILARLTEILLNHLSPRVASHGVILPAAESVEAQEQALIHNSSVVGVNYYYSEYLICNSMTLGRV